MTVLGGLVGDRFMSALLALLALLLVCGVVTHLVVVSGELFIIKRFFASLCNLLNMSLLTSNNFW